MAETDKPINDLTRQYDEIRKIATRQGGDYTTGCLLDYQYFKDHYQLIAVDLSKRKELDTDLRAIQQIEFYGMLKSNTQVCSRRKIKRNDFRILERNYKSSANNINGWIQ